MDRSSANRLAASMISVGACFFLTGASLFASENPAQVQSQSQGPTVSVASRHGVSAPMRDFKAVGPIVPGPNREVRNELNIPKKTSLSGAHDSVVQAQPGVSQPGILGQFEGPSDDDNALVLGFRFVPPDTNGDIGLNHYVQYINGIWAVYDRTGAIQLGPLAGNSFYVGFGGPCEVNNDGDPVVKYDRMADRWVLTQFAVPNFPNGPSYQCFAVSQTGDPTGAYNLYEFTIGSLPQGWGDYPKLGIWPDAYYIAFNMFTATSFAGMGNWAFDRTAMLAGDPATAIFFIKPNDGGGLPSDLDGPTPPPAGTPNYFLTPWDPVVGTLNIYEFHVDFTTPANSTFTGPIEFGSTPYVIPPCTPPATFTCVPQLGGELLDTLGDRLMNRLAYRNYGTHESLVTNNTVDAGGRTGIRWWEVRDPGGTPTVYQAATYAPDTTYRWMASIAQDHDGNMALGYSKSDAASFPSIGITGRLAADRLNTMGAEDIWFAGTGSQINSFNRWGDYSSMQIDPADDCTFWYTQEYYANTNQFDFKTRIGSFKFPSCTSPASGILEGTVTDGTNPIAGALVTAGVSSRMTDAAGHYSFSLAPDTYTVTASKFGFLPQTVPGVVVTDGGDTIQNFILVPLPTTLVNGVVTDGSGGDWPLYAKIVITGPVGFSGATVFTDPVTGYYAINLVQGNTYNFDVRAVGPGYIAGGGPVTVTAVFAPGGIVANWTLLVDAGLCTAPGYTGGPSPIFSEGFNAGTLPAGWSIVNTASDGQWTINTGPDPCVVFSGNLTGGTGPYALANSNCDGDGTHDDTELRTPSINLSAFGGGILHFNSDYRALGDVADVDVSINGGTIWTNIFRRTASARGPRVETANITGSGGQADVRLRFHYYNADFAWWWQVDNVVVQVQTPCVAGSGGLVVGNVRDANTGLGLNGATVKNLPDGLSTTTFATPGDPNQDDGFYILFAGSGPQPFEASLAPYSPADKTITVIPNSTVRLDFSLGLLDASPRPMTSKVDPGETDTQTLTLSNSGTVPVHFVINELIPWVSESPTEGDVPAGGTFLVAVTFDSTGLTPGLRQGQLTFTTAPPGAIAPVPLNFTVRFLDVLDNVPPGTDAYENYIYGAAGAGVMPGSPYPGCHPGVLNFFCPSGLVTRADMAGYIERAKHGASARPPVYTGIFSDVLPNDYNANYIQGVFDDGITVGCQGPSQPLAFCPNLPISRGQMAVFIEKGVGTFAPPTCTTFFTDVPCPPTPAAPYGNFIQQLFIDGITAGCAPPSDPDYPKFCPDQNIPNEQMAVFLVKAFGLPVLP